MYILTHLSLDKNSRYFTYDIFRCIFVNDFLIVIKMAMKFDPKGPIDNNAALV